MSQEDPEPTEADGQEGDGEDFLLKDDQDDLELRCEPH